MLRCSTSGVRSTLPDVVFLLAIVNCLQTNNDRRELGKKNDLLVHTDRLIIVSSVYMPVCDRQIYILYEESFR